MTISSTHNGPRFLRVARTLTLVSGLALPLSCGGAVDSDDTTDASAYDGGPAGTKVPPYDGTSTGFEVAPYDGFSDGTLPPPDSRSDADAMVDDSDGGKDAVAEVDTGPDTVSVDIGGPLIPPELPSEARSA